MIRKIQGLWYLNKEDLENYCIDFKEYKSHKLEGYEICDVDEDLMILNALVKCGAASSNREARQFVKGGSVMVNGEKVTDEKFVVSKEHAFGNKVTVIRRGKKKYFVINHK
jgi:tyrosyl-tRNA synthetase